MMKVHAIQVEDGHQTYEFIPRDGFVVGFEVLNGMLHIWERGLNSQHDIAVFAQGWRNVMRFDADPIDEGISLSDKKAA